MTSCWLAGPGCAPGQLFDGGVEVRACPLKVSVQDISTAITRDIRLGGDLVTALQ